MRTWLILLALAALLCAGASHQEHRASRSKRNLLRSDDSINSLRDGEEAAAVGQPEQQNNGQLQQQNNGKPTNGENGEPIVLKGEEAKKKALMARKIVHESATTAFGSHSTLPGFTQYTVVNVQLMTDVIHGQSTGTPYAYIPKNDITERDLQKDARVTTLFSRVSIDNSCDKLPLNGIDPECEKAILAGKMMKVEEDSDEHKAAYEELVKKFSGLKSVDPDKYVLRKMDIETVFVPDRGGRPLIVPLDIYNAVDPEDVVGGIAN